MRKPTAVLTAFVLVLLVPAIAVAQSGVDQYEENVPGAGGNQGNNNGGNNGGGGGSGGGGGNESSGGGGGGGIPGTSPGGEFGGRGGGFGGSGGSGGSGLGEFGGSGSGSGSGGGSGSGSGGFGSGGSGGFAESASSSLGVDTPTATLAQGLFAAAADDLTGAGTTEAEPAASSDSGGGIGIWLPIVLGVSLLVAIGWLAFRRFRGGSEGPATA